MPGFTNSWEKSKPPLSKVVLPDVGTSFEGSGGISNKPDYRRKGGNLSATCTRHQCEDQLSPNHSQRITKARFPQEVIKLKVVFAEQRTARLQQALLSLSSGEYHSHSIQLYD
jgi:hypothetical protein